MTYVDKANQYIDGVISGDIVACKLTKLACQRQKKDMGRRVSRHFPYKFDKEKANKACFFIEGLPHVKGKWAQQRLDITLEGWECFIVCTIFGWVHNKTGFRRFQEAYIELARKNGKSMLAASIGLYMFVADGEFGAEVYSGATSEKQAWEIFRPAKRMATLAPGFVDHFGITVNAKTLAREYDASRFEPIIGDPGDGAGPSCALIDEYHEHQSDALYETMTTGMAARDQPLTLIITTAGDNFAGPCYSKRQYCIKILEKTLKDEETFAVIYTVDDEDEWITEDGLRKANPNYGVSINEERLKSQQKKARNNPRQQAAFKTKHLNIWVGARNAWMNMVIWGKQPKRKTLKQLKGRQCFIGIDLASKRDIAALVMLFPPVDDEDCYHVHGKYYLPEAATEDTDNPNREIYQVWADQELLTLTPGNVIDFDYIEEDLTEISTDFEVNEVPYDPFQATQFAVHMEEQGFNMIQYGATVKNFSEPMKEIEALIYSRKLAHGDCPILRWMASNVVAKIDRKDNIFPNKEQDQAKIDGIIALIMAEGRYIVSEDYVDLNELIISRGGLL